MEDIVDLLQIKIEKAKRELPEETQNAIATVDWKAAILGLREKYGYNFEQLGDLELETELALCGLVDPEDYPKELERRMGISKAAANDLVKEMNGKVFSKIKEELIKNAERKKIFAAKKNEEENATQILNKAGIEIIHPPVHLNETPVISTNKTEKKIPESAPPVPTVPPISNIPPKIDETKKEEKNPILLQKMFGSLQMPISKTEHTLNNISRTTVPNPPSLKSKIPNADPYRERPE